MFGHKDKMIDSSLPGISIEPETKEDPPKFLVKYSCPVGRGVTMVITCRTSMFGDRDVRGELDQPSRSWVLFDPKDPADKILDREILPEIEKQCEAIVAYDAAWIKSGPTQFKDTKGDIWVKST
jgi:hypothetical protein